MSEKANLYFIRSGTVQNNKLVLPNGGIQQINYNEIFSSPARRAVITAGKIAKKQGKEVQVVPELAERDKAFLPLDEMDFSFLARPVYEDFLMQQGNLPVQLRPYHIESDREITARLMPVLDKIAIANLGLNALLTVDSDIMRFILHNFRYLTYEETRESDIQTLQLAYDKNENNFSISSVQLIPYR